MAKSEVNVGRALLASVLAGSAYLGAMWLDNRLSSHPFNDLKLTGQIFTTKSPTWQIMGVADHYTFGVVVSLAYALWAYDRLPGPGWLKGVLLLQIENALLYPAAGLLEPRHAGVQSGQVPTLFSWKSWWGQVVRHLAFGLVLGLVYRPK